MPCPLPIIKVRLYYFWARIDCTRIALFGIPYLSELTTP
jgi:hypothetical protein